uniref:Uncharacterized protein n=1 Tax=Anguilla anguilla TaxID=7936 RepID=A0A0E9TCW0_ANGAN
MVFHCCLLSLESFAFSQSFFFFLHFFILSF